MKRSFALSLVILATLGLAQIQYPATIRHDAGETVVRSAPQRIIALHPTMLEILLALGVQPVGFGGFGLLASAPAGRALESVPGFDDLLPSKPTHVGVENPSLEVMTALRPDLILSIRFAAQNVVPQFSRVAPTLVYDFGKGEGWEKAFRDMARLLGREAQAEAVLKGIEARARSSREQLAPALAKGNRMVVVALRGPQLLFTGRGFLPSRVLTDLGFTHTVPANAPSFAPGSPETLTTLDADHVFVLNYNAPKDVLDSTLALLGRSKAKGVYTIDILRASRSFLGPLSDPQLMDAYVRAVLGR
jgi:iron complex transport system substrate-binding protein